MNISKKLTLSFVGLTSVILLATLVLTRWSFERGFTEFLHAQEMDRLSRIAQDITTEYLTDVSDIKQYQNIYVNKQKLECLVQGKPIELTQVEFKLLFTLMTKPGNVYAREILMSHSYDDGRIVSHRTIDSHIKNLRNKITAIDATNNLIHSIYGVGYKIE